MKKTQFKKTQFNLDQILKLIHKININYEEVECKISDLHLSINIPTAFLHNFETFIAPIIKVNNFKFEETNLIIKINNDLKIFVNINEN